MTQLTGRWELIDSDNRPINYSESRTTVQRSSSDITREQASQFSIDATVEGSYYVDASVSTSYATQQSLREQYTSFQSNQYSRSGTQTCQGAPAGQRNNLWRFTITATGNTGQTMNGQTNHFVCSPSGVRSPRCVPQDCTDGHCQRCRSHTAQQNAPQTQVFGRNCAQEGGSCACRGTVYYLAPTAPRTRAHFNRQRKSIRNSGGRIACNNGTFGDPHHGATKMCYCF